MISAETERAQKEKRETLMQKNAMKKTRAELKILKISRTAVFFIKVFIFLKWLTLNDNDLFNNRSKRLKNKAH